MIYNMNRLSIFRATLGMLCKPLELLKVNRVFKVHAKLIAAIEVDVVITLQGLHFALNVSHDHNATLWLDVGQMSANRHSTVDIVSTDFGISLSNDTVLFGVW